MVVASDVGLGDDDDDDDNNEQPDIGVSIARNRLKAAQRRATSTDESSSSSDDEEEKNTTATLSTMPTMPAFAQLIAPVPYLPTQLTYLPPQLPLAKRNDDTNKASENASSKTPAKKKTKRDPKEDERINKLVETVLGQWKQSYNDKIEFVEEQDKKNITTDPEFYQVAKWIVLRKGKDNEEKLDVARFTSSQIRKFAIAAGVKGGGNLTIFNARRKVAQSILSGVVYTDASIANPRTTTTERKVNTLMRITNACFLPQMVERFTELNDTKYRADYEKAKGGNPIKDFWMSISELVNDPANNSELGIVLESRCEDDTRLHDFVEAGEFNLNDINVQTYLSCQQSMNDVMKAREECMKQMRLSGHHSNDLWTYAINTKLTKIRTSSQPVPAAAVYYCHVLCEKKPGIDGKFSAFLEECLKSDSSVDLTGNAGETASNGKKSKAVDAIIESINTATTTIKEMQNSANERKTTSAERESSKHWDDYIKVVDKLTDIIDIAAKLPLLRVIAIRIRKLEKLIGIPKEQSVLQGVDGIPLEVITNASETETATSDITTNKVV